MANDSEVELRLRAKNLTKEAFDQVSSALKQLEAQSDRTSSKGKSSWLSMFSSMAGGVTVGNLLSDTLKGVAGVLAELPGKVVELGQRGADVADLRGSFQSLTAAIGESADAVIGKLRTAFGGTVRDADLMKSVNETLGKGVRATASDFEILGKASRVMADQVGGDAKESFDSLLTAISTGQERVLKQLPVNFGNVEASVQRYAASLGVEASALTQSQQQQALKNALLQESKRILEENGEAENDMADNIAAINVLYENFLDNLSVAIAQSPVLSTALGYVTDAMQSAFGENQTEQIQSLIHLVDETGIVLVDVADIAVSAAGITYRAWAGVQLVFTGLGSILGIVIGGLGELVELAAKVGSALHIPGLAAAKQAISDYNDETWKSQKALHDQAAAALEAVKGNSSFQQTLNGVQTSIGGLRERLVEASKATVDADTIEKKLSGTHRDNAVAAGVADKATKEFAKSIKEMTTAIELATKNGQLETWLRQNGDAIQKLGVTAATRGAALNDTLKNALAQSFVITGREQIAGEAAAILKDQEEALKRSLDYRNNQIKAANDILAAAEKNAGDLHRKRTMDDYSYQVDLIKREEAEKIAQLQRLGAATEENLEIVRAETAEKMAAAAKAHNDAVEQMKAEMNSWGNLTRDWLGAIPTFIQNAFTGGGGIMGAVQGLFSKIGGDTLGKMFEAGGLLNGIGNSLTKGLTNIFGSSFGTAFGLALPGIGTAIGALAGPLISKLKDVFGGPSKKELEGREIVKQFEGQFKSVEEMIARVGEAYQANGKTAADAQKAIQKLWAAEKQGAEATKKALEEITAELEKHQAVMDTIHSNGFKSHDELVAEAQAQKDALDEMRSQVGQFTEEQIAQQYANWMKALAAAGDEAAKAWVKAHDSAEDSADGASSAMSELEKQRQSLVDSIKDEAPEEVMGVIEQETRAKIDALDQQIEQQKTKQEEVAKTVADTMKDAMTEAAEAAAKAWQAAMDGVHPPNWDMQFPTGPHNMPAGPYNGGSPEDGMEGHADGGLFRQSHIARISEYAPEMVGDHGFMTRALEGALPRVLGNLVMPPRHHDTPSSVNVELHLHGVTKADMVDIDRLIPSLQEALRANRGGIYSTFLTIGKRAAHG